MRVAIPVFRERISPVFDTAESLLIVDFLEGGETTRHRSQIPNRTLADRVDSLTVSGVDWLLCGAVSRPLFDMLVLAGIQVTPFISGPVDSVLNAFINGRLGEPQFKMPGCCNRRGFRRGNGRANKAIIGKKERNNS